jgi:hypothetical protein
MLMQMTMRRDLGTTTTMTMTMTMRPLLDQVQLLLWVLTSQAMKTVCAPLTAHPVRLHPPDDFMCTYDADEDYNTGKRSRKEFTGEGEEEEDEEESASEDDDDDDEDDDDEEEAGDDDEEESDDEAAAEAPAAKRRK